MNQMLLGGYDKYDLMSLIEKLDENFYETTNTLCSKSFAMVNELKKIELNQANSNYILLYDKLVHEISNFIQTRKQYFMPYLRELYTKDTTNHNCSTCSGKCSVQHTAKLIELKESIKWVHSVLNKLQMMSLPLYSETKYTDTYKALRSEMAALENSLSELFFIEETYLVPRVSAAQTKINVHN
jgi:hypothetical protein